MVVFSDVGTNIIGLMIALVVVGIWSLVWLVRLVIAYRRTGKTPRFWYRTKQIWLLEPAIVFLPLVLALAGVFTFARFAVSEPALTGYVQDVRAGKVNIAYEFNHPTRRVGLYWLNHTDLLADGSVRVLTSSHGVLDRAGLVHSPSVAPPRQGEDSYKHIKQQWWVWHESW